MCVLCLPDGSSLGPPSCNDRTDAEKPVQSLKMVRSASNEIGPSFLISFFFLFWTGAKLAGRKDLLLLLFSFLSFVFYTLDTFWLALMMMRRSSSVLLFFFLVMLYTAGPGKFIGSMKIKVIHQTNRWLKLPIGKLYHIGSSSPE